MTTIAYRAGVLAFDTQFSCGTLQRRADKAWRFKDGSLFAISGSVGDALKLRRWAESGYKEDGPALEDKGGVECLHVRKGGVYLLDGELELMHVTDEFTAIGSGAALAIGAMAHGANALESLEIAAQFDEGTSAPFKTLRLDGYRTATVTRIKTKSA